ncbi:MAG: PucR family transcriptional regulator [Nocardioides sp.]
MGELANDLHDGGRDLPAGDVGQMLTLLERRDGVQRELVNAVLAGGELTEVASRIRDTFGGSVLVTTVDGRVLCFEGDPEAVGTIRGSSVFHSSGRFLAEVSVPGLHAVEDLAGSHAVVPVAGGRIDHGRLVLFHPERDLDAEDLAVLERAADVVAICLTKQLAVTAVESKYRGDFLRDVLSGRAGEGDDVVGHARSLGWDLARPMVVVVAALDTEHGPPMSHGYQGPLELERFAAAWSTVVGRDPGTPVVGFAAEVVALLPVAEPGAERAVVERAVRGVRGDGGGGRRTFAAGVSRVVTAAEELPAAYEQARKALQAGRRLHGASAVAHFDDLGVFRLLSLIEDEDELGRFVDETLKELAPGPGATAEAATLRETLQVLLDHNLNVAEAARELHFHYNTLRYRIGKIERIVGPFSADATLRLDLALALRIVALREL